MESKRRITQRDIARAAGVDVSTVSLALGNHPRIPASTRERILSLATRMDYIPDPALSGLAAHRWQGRRDYRGLTLALALDARDHKEKEWRLYASGARRRAAAIGYGISDFEITAYPSPHRFWQVVHQRGIRGVIFIQSRQVFPQEFMTAAVAPSVHCGFLHPVEADVVMPNLEAAVRLAWQHTAQPGHRIAFYLPAEAELYSDQLLLGTALTLCRNNPKQARVFDGHPASLARMLAWNPRHIITINTQQACELSRIGFSRECQFHPLNQLHSGDTSGIDLQMEKVGAAAVDFLELKIRRYSLGFEHAKQTLMIDPVWLPASMT